MKRLGFCLLLLIGIILSTQAVPHSAAQGTFYVEITPFEIQQGRTGTVRVVTPAEITKVQAVFNGQIIPLYRTVNGDWMGFLVANMDSERGPLPLDIYTWQGDQPNPPQRETATIVWGGFDNQPLTLPGNLVPLLDPAMNAEENATLLRIYSRVTKYKLWEGTFIKPVPGEQISTFGGVRTYNDGLLIGRHTGVDYRAGTGEPVQASATGRVIFTGPLQIHGNTIAIDHGLGVISAYSHLSEIFVVPGQRVMQGDVIGAVGATGRVQGAHLHFEIAVNGFWVEPTQFMSMPFPDIAQDIRLGE